MLEGKFSFPGFLRITRNFPSASTIGLSQLFYSLRKQPYFCNPFVLLFSAVATTISPKDVALAKEKLETEFLSSDSADGDEYDVAGSIAVAHLQAFINDPANQIYATNLIHLISQLSDSLVTACGGLLPLLAATTSPTVSLLFEFFSLFRFLVLETDFNRKKFSYLKSKSAPLLLSSSSKPSYTRRFLFLIFGQSQQ